MCCFDSRDGSQVDSRCCIGCSLESGGNNSFSGTNSACSPPEPFRYAFVFLRVEGRQVVKVRTYSADCALDFGGLPLYWLENVQPSQSVALLAEFASGEGSEVENGHRSNSNHALTAIAMHDDPAADQALEKLIQPGQPQSLRAKTAFWLGVERGRRGLEILRKYVKNDADDRFREKAVFAFSQSKEPDAITDLIWFARSDPSSRVRSQAIFWMAQIGGRKEAQQITEAIENDPETTVKKRAVFALAQMKNGEGVPLLINVAKTNKNRLVRKEAIRWLGMTNDPRALDYLEQILTK
jgi:HEAT repeat protein